MPGDSSSDPPVQPRWGSVPAAHHSRQAIGDDQQARPGQRKRTRQPDAPRSPRATRAGIRLDLHHTSVHPPRGPIRQDSTSLPLRGQRKPSLHRRAARLCTSARARDIRGMILLGEPVPSARNAGTRMVKHEPQMLSKPLCGDVNGQRQQPRTLLHAAAPRWWASLKQTVVRRHSTEHLAPCAIGGQPRPLRPDRSTRQRRLLEPGHDRPDLPPRPGSGSRRRRRKGHRRWPSQPYDLGAIRLPRAAVARPELSDPAAAVSMPSRCCEPPTFAGNSVNGLLRFQIDFLKVATNHAPQVREPRVIPKASLMISGCETTLRSSHPSLPYLFISAKPPCIGSPFWSQYRQSTSEYRSSSNFPK